MTLNSAFFDSMNEQNKIWRRKWNKKFTTAICVTFAHKNREREEEVKSKAIFGVGCKVERHFGFQRVWREGGLPYPLSEIRVVLVIGQV